MPKYLFNKITFFDYILTNTSAGMLLMVTSSSAILMLYLDLQVLTWGHGPNLLDKLAHCGSIAHATRYPGNHLTTCGNNRSNFGHKKVQYVQLSFFFLFLSLSLGFVINVRLVQVLLPILCKSV